MKLTDTIVASLFWNGRALTKSEAIHAVVKRLGETALPADQLQEACEAVLNRERLGSTGIGRGVAIPHAKLPSLSKLVGAVALFRDGIDYDSIDGEPVYLLFLLLGSPNRPGSSMRVHPEAEYLMRRLNSTAFLAALREATSEQELMRILRQWDERQCQLDDS